MEILRSTFIISVIFIFVISPSAHAQQVFNSFDSLLRYANKTSITLQSGDLKQIQSQKDKLAAILGIADVSGNVSLNSTNNTKLPVSLFPAEAFGGTPGTYIEMQTGIQYTNSFFQYGEIKLINLSGWQNLHLANTNIDVVNTDNKITRKKLYENIADAYYNIVALQEQLRSSLENVKSADTILQIAKSKFEMDLLRQQDVNDAHVNYINARESVTQIEYLIQQQYLVLKILCDIPDSINIEICQNVSFTEDTASSDIYVNSLNLLGSQQKEKQALISYRQAKYSFLPTLSAFASNSNQQYSNEFSLLDNDVPWKNSNYIGFKLSWQIPSANTYSQVTKSRYNYLLAQQTTEQQQIKTSLEFEQLSIEFEKAKSQMISNRSIYQLREDTYSKNMENFKQGILGLDLLLKSYSDMVNSHYNYISSSVNVMHVQSDIKINNEIQ